MLIVATLGSRAIVDIPMWLISFKGPGSQKEGFQDKP